MSTEINPFSARAKAITNSVEAKPLAVLEPVAPSKIQVEWGVGLRLTTLEEVREVAQIFWDSGFYPTGFRDPKQIMAVLIRAVELGVPPGQAMEEAYVVGGRVSFKGTTLLAIVRKSGLLVGSPKKEYKGEGKDLSCTVTMTREGSEPASETFSVSDADAAGLSKNDNWRKYPKRMTYFRALGFLLRDEFSDVLRGMVSREEAEDYPTNNKENNPFNE